MGLYKISADLQAIFNEIEENSGEVTDELIEKLQIGEEELKDKLNSYVQVISNLQSDVDQCSVEIKRIQEIKKSKENLIDKLKEAVLKAVQTFGEYTKSGTKCIDLGTCKLSTRKSTSVEVYKDFVDSLTDRAANYLHGLNANKMLLGSDPHRDREFIDNNKLTDYDLYAIDFKISIDIDALSAIRGNYDELFEILMSGKNADILKIEASVDKTKAKTMMLGSEPLSIAKINNNQSLTIK